MSRPSVRADLQLDSMLHSIVITIDAVTDHTVAWTIKRPLSSWVFCNEGVR